MRMLELPASLQKLIESNEPWQLAMAAGLSALVFTIAWGARRWVRARYERYAATTAVELLEMPLEVASKTTRLFMATAALLAGLSALTLTDSLWRAILHVATAVAFWQVGVWGSSAVLAWLRARRATTQETDRAASSSLGIIGFVLRMLVWLLVVLLALDNFGVDITALVAGLGVGGIAVALAVQNVLGDLFASLSITLDRPFVLGDFIVVDDFAGSVEHIGVKSTRLRSINGEQIVMANADLLGSRIRNYGRMQERRVLFTLGVTYETPRETLLQIPAIIRRCIDAQTETRFDRSHFAHYGASSLDFETVYYVLSADFTKHMEIRQAVYFAIHEAFEAAGIDFAYPTQKLWVTQVEPAKGSAERDGAPAQTRSSP